MMGDNQTRLCPLINLFQRASPIHFLARWTRLIIVATVREGLHLPQIFIGYAIILLRIHPDPSLP